MENICDGTKQAGDVGNNEFTLLDIFLYNYMISLLLPSLNVRHVLYVFFDRFVEKKQVKVHYKTSTHIAQAKRVMLERDQSG